MCVAHVLNHGTKKSNTVNGRRWRPAIGAQVVLERSILHTSVLMRLRAAFVSASASPRSSTFEPIRDTPVRTTLVLVHTLLIAC